MSPAFLAFVLCTGALTVDPVLVDSLSPYAPDFVLLEDGRIYYIDTDERIRIADTGDPEVSWSYASEYSPVMDGWGYVGTVRGLMLSPDGSTLCWLEQVTVPDELQPEEGYVPGPICIVAATPDGADGRILGLSFDVGGGPGFSFTRDSRYVFGSPLLDCPPNPEDYVAYFADEAEYEGMEGFMIDVVTGERSGGRGDLLGDGFNPNPWSDLVASGWYPPNMIADVTTGEVLLEDTTVNTPAIISTWVLPDAGLARSTDGQVLRYADGREVPVPGGEISFYGAVGEGDYLFSMDGGETLLLGGINWSVPGPAEHDTLTGIPGPLHGWSRAKGLPGGGGFVLRSGSRLLLCSTED